MSCTQHARLISRPTPLQPRVARFAIGVFTPRSRQRPNPRLRPLGSITTCTSMPGLHDRYVQEMEGHRAQGRQLDAVIYGDSICEAFRGTCMGFADGVWDDNRLAFEELVGDKYSTAVCAIAGDRAVDLLWRLKHGEGPRGVHVRAVLVMIGTNDVFTAVDSYSGEFDPQQASAAIFQDIRLVLEEAAAQAPEAALVVLSLPPLQPLGLGAWEQSRYQALVDAVNERLEAYAAERAQQGQSVRYADCTSPFLLGGEGRWIDRGLAPDGCHPEGPGGRVLAETVLRVLEDAVGQAPGR